MGGVLRHITPKTWAGELNGYRVQVFRHGNAWVGSVRHPQGFTAIQLEAERFEWAAAKARAWVEENPLPAVKSPTCTAS